MKLGDRLIRRMLGMRGQTKTAGYWTDTITNIIYPGANNIGALVGTIAGEPSIEWMQKHNNDGFFSKLMAVLFPGVGAYNIQRRSAFTKSDQFGKMLADAGKSAEGLVGGTSKTASAQNIGADMGRMLDAASRRQQELSRAVDGPISRYVRGAALRHPGATMEGAKAGAQLGAVASDVAPGAVLGGVGAMLLAAALGSENWGKWGLAGALAGGAANGVYNANA